MTQKEILTELRRNAVMDNFRCLGCGHEHNCSTHGCAVNLAAAELIEQLAAEIAALGEIVSNLNTISGEEG